MEYAKTRFNEAPQYWGKKRTRFDLSHSILTTCNTGDFVPVCFYEVYPGETFSMKTASLVRLETSLHQTLDNAYGEIAYFFVPWRILWDNFDKFLGANDDPWDQQTVYSIPQLLLTGNSEAATVQPGSLINHLALPAGSYGAGSTNQFLSISHLPLRAVFQVWNDWYRDENYDSIIYFSKGNNGKFLGDGYYFNGSYVSANVASDMLKVNRFKDLFSTALPAPQKGQPVSIGLAGSAPIKAGSSTTALGNPLVLGTNIANYYAALTTADEKAVVGLTSTSESALLPIVKTNLYADLTQSQSITINQLRLAIVAQSINERNARSGTRLKEIIQSTWHVDCPDARLDRSEFLGGKRFPINMMEVLQTSETGTTVLGSDAGHSKTADYSDGFIRTFLEYGCVIGFFYLRTARSYSQGINRQFFRKDKIDLYDPLMDNIGEVAVLNRELMSLKTSTDQDVDKSNEAFGYQEAWYELKEMSNRFSGYFQPGISGTLDSWHYGDNYQDSNSGYVFPAISPSWLKETEANVDRTIAVQSSAAFQWSLNLHFECYATRQMDKYSIPNTFGF